MRSGKDPWRVVSPETTLATNVIGSNSGNFLFSYSAHRMLSRADTEVVSQGLGFNLADPAAISAEYDHLVLPMANSFRRDFVRQLDIISNVIEKVDIPVTVLSVGAQAALDSGSSALSHLDQSVKRFVAAVLDKSPTIGVRGEFTAEYLRGLGFADVEVIGCPSTFLHGDKVRVEKKRESIDHDARVSFSVTPRVKQMGPVTMRHVERFPNMRLIPQDSDSLRMMLWGNALPGFAAGDDMPFYGAHPAFRRDLARFFVDPQPWIDYMGTLDFAFGDRIHGNVAAILAGTPALLIAHDSRTLELARYHQIPHILTSDLGPDDDAVNFYELADYTAFNAGQPARWANFEAYLAKNGLQHSLDDEEQLARYDARVAAADFPAAVRAVTRDPRSTQDLDRTDWLYKELGRQTGAIKRLQQAHRENVERIEVLQAQVAALQEPAPQPGGARQRLSALGRRVRR
jgi:hypothetical protein